MNIYRIISLVVAVAFVYVGFDSLRFLVTGPGSSEEQVVFEVPPGSTFQQVARALEENGVVRDAFRLRILGRLTGKDAQLKRGEYALNRGMSPQEVLGILASGKSIQYPVTFPEGSNVFEMAAILEEKKLMSADEFIKAARDKEMAKQLLGIEVSSLEGYLFPETYNITKFTTVPELLTAMVNNFKSAYATLESGDKAMPVPLSRHEVVTLASVVEKETGAPEERPMIASVFFNRLQKNMKLQSDPTIIYGIWVQTGAYKQNITKNDILKPSPYNTYTVPRLPFGPIANPGREALAAVFKPARSEYLFFVSRNDGTHIFTKTYEDHTKAVQDYQLNPEAREGRSWRDLKKRPAGT